MYMYIKDIMYIRLYVSCTCSVHNAICTLAMYTIKHIVYSSCMIVTVYSCYIHTGDFTKKYMYNAGDEMCL